MAEANFLSADNITAETPHAYPFFVLRSLFYLILPSEISFSSPTEVPAVLSSSAAATAPFFVLELILAIFEHKLAENFDPIDCASSLICMCVTLLEKSFFRMAEFSLYEWVYAHYAVVHFEATSVPLFIFSLIGIDFVRYWEHRFWHENNVFWQFHKLHHSPEYYNLFTGARTNYMQNISTMILYTPMALIVPPAQFYVHFSINYLFPFWQHTALIPKLAWPLESVVVTPSHHRVHHGRNRYCIDKNYGAQFIVWDFLFGTFAEEREEEPVFYGTIDTTTTFNMARKFFDLSDVVKKWRAMPTMNDKLKSVVLGPGWMPGKPRLGDPEDIPEVKSDDPKVRIVIAHPIPIGSCVMAHVGIGMIFCMQASTMLEQQSQILIALGHLCGYWLLYTVGDSLDKVDGKTLANQGAAHCGFILYALVSNFGLELATLSFVVWMVECILYNVLGKPATSIQHMELRIKED